MKKLVFILWVSLLLLSVGNAKIVCNHTGYNDSVYEVSSVQDMPISKPSSILLVRCMSEKVRQPMICSVLVNFKETHVDYIENAWFKIIYEDSSEAFQPMFIESNTLYDVVTFTSFYIPNFVADKILSAKKVRIKITFYRHSPVKFVLSKSLLKEWKIVSEAQFIKKTE